MDDDFLLSLQNPSTSPSAQPMIHAVWLALHGHWDAAHELAQSDDGRDAAWVHAWLHRVEGDIANARYWYRHAGRECVQGDTQQEGYAIGMTLMRASR